jgi:hypothetical protein
MVGNLDRPSADNELAVGFPRPLIHKAPSYGLRNCSGGPQRNFQWMRIWWMKNQCLQDERVDWSSHCVSICVGFWRFPKDSGGKLHWELKEFFGNLQILTQMLSYIFISFQGWSSKGAWSWWLVPLVQPFRGRIGVRSPLLASSPPQVLVTKDLVWNFHPRFVSGWRWRFHPTWSFSSSTRWEEKPEMEANIRAFKTVKSQSMAKYLPSPQSHGKRSQRLSDAGGNPPMIMRNTHITIEDTTTILRHYLRWC